MGLIFGGERGSEEIIRFASTQLISTLSDVQETLTAQVEGNKKYINDPNLIALVTASDRFIGFINSPYRLQHATLRHIRNDDRRKLLPGQHPGIYLQFSEPVDNTTLLVNFWGGLRTTSSEDYQDRDVSQTKRSHVLTTDKILEQPVQFNWQFVGPGQSAESWIVLNQKDRYFQQGALRLDGQSFDIHPSINKNPYFEQFRSSLSTAARDLTFIIKEQ